MSIILGGPQKYGTQQMISIVKNHLRKHQGQPSIPGHESGTSDEKQCHILTKNTSQ